MKTFLAIISYGIIAVTCSAQSGSTDSLVETTVHGKLILANVGFAPVPAFSFDKPIAIGFLTIKKKRFSYNPDFSLGLDGRPWLANHWFMFTVIEKRKNKFNVALNPSFYFKSEKPDSIHELVHAHRNLTLGLMSTHQISERVSINFTYMQIHAFDRGALSGTFFDISSFFQILQLKNFVKLMGKSQLFYFAFENNIKGISASATVNVEFKKAPLSIYYQGVQPIKATYDGAAFKWNVGLIYNF